MHIIHIVKWLELKKWWMKKKRLGEVRRPRAPSSQPHHHSWSTLLTIDRVILSAQNNIFLTPIHIYIHILNLIGGERGMSRRWRTETLWDAFRRSETPWDASTGSETLQDVLKTAKLWNAFRHTETLSDAFTSSETLWYALRSSETLWNTFRYSVTHWDTLRCFHTWL